MKKLFLQRPAKTVLSLLLCTVLTASSPGSPMTAAAAGGLNADEQALLNDFAAGITVDGQLLQPPASYVALASDLLSSVDLSTSEVDRLYAKMDAAYDALRSEHITSVEEAQNSLAKNIVYAITSEAMQILENSPNKTDTSDDDDDEDYEDDNDSGSIGSAATNNNSAGQGNNSTGSQQSNGNVGGQQDNNGNSQQNSNPADGSGSSQQSSNPAANTGNSQQSSDTANGSSSDTAVSNGDASAAGTDSAATGEAADNSGQASDESPEAEMSIQMDGSDSSETGANASEKDAFPYPIAIGAAFILLAVVSAILFFRHRRDR